VLILIVEPTDKIAEFYDTKIRINLVWPTLIISILLTLWKGIDYRLITVILSCIIYIIFGENYYEI
jgi:hypothetical protein